MQRGLPTAPSTGGSKRRLIPITIALVLAAAGCSGGTTSPDATPSSDAPGGQSGTSSPAAQPSTAPGGGAEPEPDGPWAVVEKQLRTRLQEWEDEGATGVGYLAVAGSHKSAMVTATVVQDGKLVAKSDNPVNDEVHLFPEEAVMPFDAIDVDSMIRALEETECPDDQKNVWLRGYEEHRNIRVQCMMKMDTETSWQDGEKVPEIAGMLPSERLVLLKKLYSDMTGQDVVDVFSITNRGTGVEVSFVFAIVNTHKAPDGTPVAGNYHLMSNGATLIDWVSVEESGEQATPMSSYTPEGLDKAISTDTGAPVAPDTEYSFSGMAGEYISSMTRRKYTLDGDPV